MYYAEAVPMTAVASIAMVSASPPLNNTDTSSTAVVIHNPGEISLYYQGNSGGIYQAEDGSSSIGAVKAFPANDPVFDTPLAAITFGSGGSSSSVHLPLADP